MKKGLKLEFSIIAFVLVFGFTVWSTYSGAINEWRVVAMTFLSVLCLMGTSKFGGIKLGPLEINASKGGKSE